MSDRVIPRRVNAKIDTIVKRVCGITSFNVDIYHLLDGYLSSQEFRAFLHTNKHMHEEYIDHRYISLNNEYSLLYY